MRMRSILEMRSLGILEILSIFGILRMFRMLRILRILDRPILLSTFRIWKGGIQNLD